MLSQGTRGEAKKDEPLPRHIREVLGKYKDVLTNELPQELPSKREVDHKIEVIPCRAPLLEECPQHHGHKGDPGVMPGTCGAIGERAQVILVWVRAPGRWERLPPMETRSHEG